MNRVKRILNTALSRIVLAALFMLLQIAVLVIMVLAFQRYFVYFYAVCSLITIGVALYVLNSRDNPAYKIAWILPILILPVFGTLLFLMFGRTRLTRRGARKMKEITSRYNEALEGYESSLTALQKADPDAACQSRYISATTRAPLFDRTEAEFLPTGELYFERLLEQLKNARHFIFLEYFIIEEGKMWSAILAVLQEKAAQGVEVRVVYDDFGCITTLPDKYDKMLEKMGIQACVFNKFKPVISGLFNNRDHRKICVIDGNIGFTGGVNLADEYINAVTKHGHWMDCGICLRGEGVWGLTVMFLSLWNFLCGEADKDFRRYAPTEDFLRMVKTDGYVQPFTDTPLDDEAVGENVYLNLISRARDYVYITTPYLVVGSEMLRALCTAAKSGVDVRILTPHIADKKPVHAVTRSHYPMLAEAGVRIFEYTPGFIHSKTFVCDDKYGVVGTINLDFRSLYLHFECATWLCGASCVGAIKEDYLQMLKICTEISAEQCRSYHAPRKLWLSILRVFSPLL